MRIKIADNSGICFGVRRAFTMLEEAAANAQKEGRTAVMLGPMIHNPRVIEEYAEKGIKVVDIDSVPAGSLVIIRSHGIVKEDEKKLCEKEGLTLIDTICPYVKRIHLLVEKKSSEGAAILVMGDRGHSEVQGITSRISGDFFVIHPSEFTDKNDVLVGFIRSHANIFAVAQTTSRPSNYEFLLKKVRKIIKEDNPSCKFQAAETICTATLKRQDSAGELAARTDAMIVIGGRNSSNTSKLFQVTSERNKNSFWIESAEDISASDLETIKASELVGITAGASTPDEQITEIVSFLEKLNG